MNRIKLWRSELLTIICITGISYIIKFTYLKMLKFVSIATCLKYINFFLIEDNPFHHFGLSLAVALPFLYFVVRLVAENFEVMNNKKYILIFHHSRTNFCFSETMKSFIHLSTLVVWMIIIQIICVLFTDITLLEGFSLLQLIRILLLCFAISLQLFVYVQVAYILLLVIDHSQISLNIVIGLMFIEIAFVSFIGNNRYIPLFGLMNQTQLAQLPILYYVLMNVALFLIYLKLFKNKDIE